MLGLLHQFLAVDNRQKRGNTIIAAYPHMVACERSAVGLVTIYGPSQAHSKCAYHLRVSSCGRNMTGNVSGSILCTRHYHPYIGSVGQGDDTADGVGQGMFALWVVSVRAATTTTPMSMPRREEPNP